MPVLGGGSTFAAPLYRAWIEAYGSVAPTVDIGYDVIGSGEGIDRFLAGSLDFAATDAPLTTEQEAEVDGGVTHVPVTAGMVAIAYNLPGDLEGELRLPRDVLGDIFAGRITSWDDPRMVAANPGLELPHQTLYVVARLDGSGTTYAFTNHLDATSDTWRRRRPRCRYPRRLAKPGDAGPRERGGRGEHPARGRDHRLRGVRDRQAGGPAARRASECSWRLRHAIAGVRGRGDRDRHNTRGYEDPHPGPESATAPIRS